MPTRFGGALLFALLAFLACSDTVDPKDRHTLDDTTADTNADSPSDTDDTGEPAAEGCRAPPAAADRDRLVVFSLPYTAGGDPAKTWSTAILSADGELRDDGQVFELGRAWSGVVSFSPDGSLGVTVHDDGSIGVFLIDADNFVAVVESAFDGGFYADRAVVDPSGESVWIVDGNWVNNGGGLYRVALDCDTGAPGEPEKILDGKLGADFHFFQGRKDRALLAAWDVPGSAAGEELALLDLTEIPTWMAGAEIFTDDDAIISDAALTPDDQWVLLADNSEFSGLPTRIGVASTDGESFQVETEIDIEDPVALVPSPESDLILVVSGYANAFFVLEVTADGIRDSGEMDYVGSPPQLPSAADLVRRGTLSGTVVATEIEGLRTVRFLDGTLNDIGLMSLGQGLDRMPGAIGIAP